MYTETSTHFETPDLSIWRQTAEQRGFQVIVQDGKGEDPFTHYYAVRREDRQSMGYFGDGNGADASWGMLCNTPEAYKQEMGEAS